ncbi:hypothetical protein [Blastococcus mobilis]|uniref:hypothetical protein n=1 Tax=Blastococcus mobilis TaxID=1938746 RepID=UPI0015957001|nr:hypothetical protein [Blastococcus mobilis]
MGHRCSALRGLAGTQDSVAELQETVRCTRGAVLVTAGCLGACALAAVAAVAHRDAPTGRSSRTVWLAGVHEAPRAEALAGWITAGGPAPDGTPDADLPVVACFYFYLWDVDFGPAFIKICAYFPYPAKIWLNGHEWAKRQATRAGIGFTELSNGFAAAEDPDRLQALCDRLGPGTIGVFAERWLSVLPTPLTDADREAGYWWELSMRQVEVSRTIVFTQPRHARGFFEALGADDLDIGRPDQVELIFSGRRYGEAADRPFRRPSRPRSSPAASTSPSTPSTSTPGSSNTSKTAARYASKPSSPTPTTWAASAACPTSRRCRPRPVTPTADCSILNGSARAASSRVQPLSGSRTPPSPWRGGGPRPCGSATLGSKPWPAPSAPACSPSPASPTRACAP